jgi:hypothetical protein
MIAIDLGRHSHFFQPNIIGGFSNNLLKKRLLQAAQKDPEAGARKIDERRRTSAVR